LQPAKFIGRIFTNILGGNAKFGGKRQNFEYFSNLWSNFEADFGAPCDYHKSVTKFLEIFMTLLNFFKKGNKFPNFWP